MRGAIYCPTIFYHNFFILNEIQQALNRKERKKIMIERHQAKDLDFELTSNGHIENVFVTFDSIRV